MLLTRLVACMFPLGMMVLDAHAVSGETYPNKPIRIIATQPGGLTDIVARLIAPGLTANLGQQIVVDNRGNGIVAVEIAAKAPPDGYTLLVNGSAFWLMPHVKSGRLKGLAVCSAQPSDLAPGLPTVAATGLPGYELVSPQAVFVPAKTPAALVRRLHDEILRVMRAPEVKERLFNTGMEVVGSTPQELAAAIKSEVARMGKVIKDVGIREE